MANIYDTLKDRGFIEQTTDEEEIRQRLEGYPIPFYIGFDPTGDSLHLGHFVQVMVMKHLQRAGHIPIALIGGGTAMIGDPSGKTEMRRMLSDARIEENARAIERQLQRYLDLEGDRGYVVNNAEWLRDMNYIDFLRDFGVHFSVNRMLTAECFKSRMEKGLSFLEFNYMLLQAYDFFHLHRELDCILQLGGNDQWSNILAGIDLIRRKASQTVYGITFKLLTTSEGHKMGKTESGAIWLDPNKTPPYDLYQYLRNVDDADVENTLSLLTFLPMEEVRKLSALKGKGVNRAKEVLAYEFTKIVHGEQEARKAQEAARALFRDGAEVTSATPSTEIERSRVEEGLGLLQLLREVGLTSSNSEGRRLIEQGGIYIGEGRVETIDREIGPDDFTDGQLTLRKGKKHYHLVILND